MNNIIVVIGQSASGKTTYIKEKYLLEERKIINDIVPYTVSGNNALIGKYGIERREQGTDTLSFNAVNKIIELIEKIKDKYDIVIVEGDRINNSTFFKYLFSNKDKDNIKLIIFITSIGESMKRLKLAGSSLKKPFLNMTKTKSWNNYIKYKKYFSGKIIRT